MGGPPKSPPQSIDDRIIKDGAPRVQPVLESWMQDVVPVPIDLASSSPELLPAGRVDPVAEGDAAADVKPEAKGEATVVPHEAGEESAAEPLRKKKKKKRALRVRLTTTTTRCERQ